MVSLALSYKAFLAVQEFVLGNCSNPHSKKNHGKSLTIHKSSNKEI